MSTKKYVVITSAHVILLFIALVPSCKRSSSQKEETPQQLTINEEVNQISIEMKQAEIRTTLGQIYSELDIRVLVSNNGKKDFDFDELRAGFYFEGELITGCTTYIDYIQQHNIPAVMFSSDNSPEPPHVNPTKSITLRPGNSVKLPISSGPSYEFGKTTGLYGFPDSKKREIKISLFYKGKAVTEPFILEVPKELPYKKVTDEHSNQKAGRQNTKNDMQENEGEGITRTSAPLVDHSRTNRLDREFGFKIQVPSDWKEAELGVIVPPTLKFGWIWSLPEGLDGKLHVDIANAPIINGHVLVAALGDLASDWSNDVIESGITPVDFKTGEVLAEPRVQVERFVGVEPPAPVGIEDSDPRDEKRILLACSATHAYVDRDNKERVHFLTRIYGKYYIYTVHLETAKTSASAIASDYCRVVNSISMRCGENGSQWCISE